MKYKFTLLAILIPVFLIGQNPTKNEIVTSYQAGEKIRELIRQKKTSELNEEFAEMENVDFLLDAIKSEQFDSKEFDLHSDIYYNPDLHKYIYTIYCSQWIKTDSDWGLNNYLFVIELQIKHAKNDSIATIESRRILNQKSNLKSWWRSLMDSYRDEKYLRTQWANDYRLVPPPPPPPQSNEWL